MWWKDNHDELSKCKTCKEKQAKRIYEHKEIIKRVGGLYIASDATMARQGCHMGTILLQVSVVSIIFYNMHFLQINA
jgi:hypothetical protein